MENSEIVRILNDIADLLELKGESVFKIRAYQKAAHSIEYLSEDIAKLVAENRLKEIPGVGDAISKKITELITTGHLEYYNKLRAEFPEGIGALMEIPGIGPRTALILARDLGVTTIDELEKSIQDGRLATLPRMGEKTAQNILRQIQNYRKKKNELRVSLGVALTEAESLLEELKYLPGLKNLALAGSLRRFKDTIGDIDIVGTADNPQEVFQRFTTMPRIREVLETGTTKASVIISSGMQVDLRLVDHDSFGSALQHSTGSQQHSLNLRQRAERLGLSLSEYGITNLATGELHKCPTEEGFYQQQGLEYIPPEIREGRNEIELAEKDALPRLIDIRDIRGDLHVHSDWSDGSDSLEDLALAAQARGYQYLAITDHSVGLGIAHGLDIERLHQQIQKIKEINQRFSGIRLLTGVEVDIRANGTLDIPDEILAELDIVLASVHSSMNQSEEQMTRRIISAMENPQVDIIAHPTGRLLGERDPAAINMEELFQAAIQNKTALEISAMPSRLDLKDTHVYRARELGVKMVINTDAHRIEHLDLVYFGVRTARRGWCAAGDILNTLPLAEFLAFLKR